MDSKLPTTKEEFIALNGQDAWDSLVAPWQAQLGRELAPGRHAPEVIHADVVLPMLQLLGLQVSGILEAKRRVLVVGPPNLAESYDQPFQSFEELMASKTPTPKTPKTSSAKVLSQFVKEGLLRKSGESYRVTPKGWEPDNFNRLRPFADLFNK